MNATYPDALRTPDPLFSAPTDRRTTPEVVVLDIVMDGMGGVAAACEIQAIAPETKIVFISTHYTAGEASVITRFLGAGAFVQKAETGR